MRKTLHLCFDSQWERLSILCNWPPLRKTQFHLIDSQWERLSIYVLTAIEKILSNLCNIQPKRIDFPFHVIDKQGEKTLHFIAVESQRERLSNYVLTANENRLSIKCNRRSIGIDSPFYVIYVNENKYFYWLTMLNSVLPFSTLS